MFRILDLPPELREHIYYFAMGPNYPPIDTANIPGTPDDATIPALAQVSQQLRGEALAVFYRNRTVKISLYGDENVRQAKAWVNAWAMHAQEFSSVTFAGTMRCAKNEFFHIAIDCVKNAPYFKIHVRPGVSECGEEVLEYMLSEVEGRLARFRRSPSKDEKGGLTASQLRELVGVVHRSAQSTERAIGA